MDKRRALKFASSLVILVEELRRPQGSYVRKP